MKFFIESVRYTWGYSVEYIDDLMSAYPCLKDYDFEIIDDRLVISINTIDELMNLLKSVESDDEVDFVDGLVISSDGPTIQIYDYFIE